MGGVSGRNVESLHTDSLGLNPRNFNIIFNQNVLNLHYFLTE